MSGSCYVYYIVVDGIVRYVGKGTRGRAVGHIRFANYLNSLRSRGKKLKVVRFHNRLAKAIREGSEVQSRIILNNLSSSQAFQKEKEAIASFPQGQLWNETNGGDGFDSETRKKQWQDPVIREKYLATFSSPQNIERCKERADIQWSNPDAVEFARQQATDLWNDSNFREKTLASIREANTPEVYAKVSETTAKNWQDPEFHAKMCAAIKAACSTPESSQRRKEAWKKRRRKCST